MKIKWYSVVTCPECGFQQKQKMPENACVIFYECPNCHAVLRPKQGDCCIYCSYGDVPCPPVQKENNPNCC